MTKGLSENIKKLIAESVQSGTMTNVTSEERETISRVASSLAGGEYFNPYCEPCLFRAAHIIYNELNKQKTTKKIRKGNKNE